VIPLRAAENPCLEFLCTVIAGASPIAHAALRMTVSFVRAGFQRPINWSALGKMGDISPRVQQHLLKVYATLSTGILAAAIGAYIDHKFFVAGVVTQLALFAAVIGLNFIHGLTRPTGPAPGASPLFVSVCEMRT